MPKFDKDKTQARDELVRKFVTEHRNASLADINDVLKAETGARMNSTRLSKLRERIYADLGVL